MTRLPPWIALFTSLCALFTAGLLWREVRTLRQTASPPHVEPARLGDDDFARIQKFAAVVKANYAAETAPKAHLLLAERLLNKARWMHGDIGPEEWRRLQMATEPELSDAILKRYQSGIDIQEGFDHYGDILQTPR